MQEQILNLPIHHIGIATYDLHDEWQLFKKIGFVKEAEFIDKAQGVRGYFVVPINSSFPQYRLELLESLECGNAKGQNVLAPYLKRNIKMYHIAYESRDLETDCQKLLLSGAREVVPIIDAAYFARICFVILENNMLIELVEMKE